MLSRLSKGSIKKKLAILFLVAALPTIVIIVFAGLDNHRRAVAGAEQELKAFSRHLAQTQTLTTQAVKTFLEGLALLPEVRQADAEGCNRLFASLLKINPVYAAIHLVDRNGELVASGSAGGPANFAHTRHFSEALTTRAFATGEYLLGVTLGVPVFTFGYPVLDDQGEVRSALLTSIRLDRYGDLFKHTRFPENSFVGVCDRNGTRLFRFPENIAIRLGEPIQQSIFRHAASDAPEGLLQESGTDGVERIVAFQQLRLDPEQPPYMYFFVGAPSAMFYAEAQNGMLRDLGILFLAIGLTLISGWFLGGRTIGVRLEELAEASKRIGQGDLSARVPPAPEITEVDMLSGAFNNMAESLAQDIVRRTQAEDALRQSEHKHKIIFQHSPLGILFFDHEGTIVDCNEPFITIMGSTREKLIGFNTARQSSPKMRDTIKKALAGEVAVFEDEYTSITGGVTKSLRVVFNPISPEQTPSPVIATLEDITERKEAEKALVESESRFRNLFEQVPSVAVQGYGMDGTTLYWNLASENLYGYAAQEALGKKLIDLIIPPEMREEVNAAMRSMAETKIPIPASELTLLRKDGSRIVVFSSHALVEKAGGEPVLFCIDIDLTSRKEAEEALLRLKEAAESANQAKSEFLANMSHEIRTPINGVMGMLQLLQMTRLDSEQEEYATTAIQSCKRLARLLTDILDLSRIEAGKLSLQPAPMNLTELFWQTRDLFSPIARNSNVELRFDLDPSIPAQVMGDAARLQQILTNMVGNALKFTPAGSVAMTATLLSPLREKQCRVLFSVSDTGIGIPDDKLAALFKPFSQVNAGYTRSYQGAGLGLSICKRLVGLMGGNISVVNEPGAGTTMYFSIPFELKKTLESNLAGRGYTASAALTGLNILLAEDDFVSAVTMTKLLQKFSATVKHVENGREALDILRKEPFNLILMDVQMPVMDGVEATRAIRSGHGGEDMKDIPIIAMTAYAMTGDKEKFLEAGMSGYVAKPVVIEELMSAIGKTSRSSS
jgi:PAS domain S-box-containing protein